MYLYATKESLIVANTKKADDVVMLWIVVCISIFVGLVDVMLF